MPIHLPPFSRRKFITRAVTAGTGLVFLRDLLAAETPVDPHSWALLADTHIAADPETVSRNTNMTKNLLAVGREIVEWPKRPAGVLVNGDCAYNTGQPGDYANFTGLLDLIRQTKLSIHVTLGNHDERNHFWDALPEKDAAPRAVSDRHAGILRSERANWFLLDSLEKTNSTPGLLGEAQLDWLAKSLDANANKPAIIFSHHNLEQPETGEAKSGLKDTEKLLAVLEPRQQVKAYIYGHTHNWGVQWHPSGLYLVNLPPVAYVFNEGKPNGWVWATVQPEGLRLELRCLDPKHPFHGQVTDLKWRAG